MEDQNYRRRGWYLLIVMIALTIVSTIGMTRLSFAFNFESFLPANDSDIVFLDNFKRHFEKGSNTVQIGIEPEGGIFNLNFLESLAEFTRCARRLPMARDGYSLVTLKDYYYDPIAPQRVPVLDFRHSKSFRQDSLRIMQDIRFPGQLISYDGKMIFINISLNTRTSQREEDEFIDGLNHLLREFGWENNSYYVGYPVFHQTMLKYQTNEFSAYTLVATLTMLLCMGLIFQRWWGTGLAFISVILGLIYFFGFLGWSGKQIDLMATLFPVLLVIVGTSDVIHILTRYIDELELGTPRRQALRLTLREIGVATFMTSLTTAIGFLSLLTSRMPPIRSFGMYAAIGVFIAFGTAILLTSTLASWFSGRQLMRTRKNQLFTSTTKFFESITVRYPRQIIYGTSIFLCLAIYGSTHISFNLTTQRDFPRGSKALEDFKMIDTKVKGVNSLDMALEISGEGESFFDLKTLRELERLTAFIEDLPETGRVTSPLLFFKILNYSFSGLNPQELRLPETQAELDRMAGEARKYFGNALGTILSKSGKQAWLFAKVPDLGSRKLNRLKIQIDEWVKSELDSGIFQLTQTGARHIFDKNQELLVISLLKSIGLAFLLVSLFMGIVFRDLRIVLISLIPNFVPLVATAGLIGFLRFPMDPKVAIVFTVAFGIAVDDSIHFLSRFKLERDKGHTVNEAISLTFKETGRAIVITTVILMAGFGTLLFSVFPPTFTIGLLLTLTLFIALLADFLLLPICLRYWLGQREAGK